MAQSSRPIDEFVCAVHELAAADTARGWLTAVYGAAAYETGVHGGDDIAVAPRGRAVVTGGRLSGRWQAVVGAEHADWLLLTAESRRLVVSRSGVSVRRIDQPGALSGVGLGDVIAEDAVVEHEMPESGTAVAAACTAAAVAGSADGVWRGHVERLRARLAISHLGDESEGAVQIARAASDIDAARLQIATAAATGGADTWPYAQAVARARAATDRLMASSRHALDAADPVALRWREVHAGCRLAAPFVELY